MARYVQGNITVCTDNNVTKMSVFLLFWISQTRCCKGVLLPSCIFEIVQYCADVPSASALSTGLQVE